MLKNSRSPSTFSKHQRENESLAVYFWLDNDKQQYLTTELQHDLADADMEIDYSHLEARHRRYIRQGGKKSLEARKEEWRIILLKSVVKGYLGPPGTSPPRRAFVLDALTSDVKIYMNYIADKVKADGSLMKPDVYKGYRSSLTYLFTRYRYTPREGYYTELSRYMNGAA